MCRASDYYSRSSSGRHDRYYDREPDRYPSEKPKSVAPAQVMSTCDVAELTICRHVIAQLMPLLQAPTKSETPKERLKRLMAAQINKQVAKDSVKSAQKVAHEEKERKARIQIERMHYDGGRRSPSHDRYRSVLSFAPGLENVTKAWSHGTH